MTGFDIWNELGNTYFKVGAYNEAIDAYAKAIELNPKFGWAYSNLALAYTRSGRLLEAIPHYQKSIELLQDKVDKAISLNRLGDAYRQLNEYDNAAAAYEAADRLGPNSALPAENLPADAPAPAGQQEGHDPLPAPGAPNSAPAAAQSAGTPEASLKNARVWNELGNIFAKAGTYDEAIQAYQKAIRLAPNFAWPYSNLALAHTHKANFTEAIPLYKKSIELFTDNKDKAVSWDRLGDAYRRMNVYKDAIAAYEIAKKLAQEDSPAVYDLREVGIDQILLVPSHTHIRAGVDELAESIRMHGIIQPLIVCESGPGNFVLVAGKRRLEAARQVGLERVPVIVRRMDEREMLEVAITPAPTRWKWPRFTSSWCRISVCWKRKSPPPSARPATWWPTACTCSSFPKTSNRPSPASASASSRLVCFSPWVHPTCSPRLCNTSCATNSAFSRPKT